MKIKGFRRVLDYVIENKKPIIGHNMMHDCVRMVQQFLKNLPESSYNFKQNFSQFFPESYDTKYILEKTKLFLRTDLSYAYQQSQDFDSPPICIFFVFIYYLISFFYFYFLFLFLFLFLFSFFFTLF